MPQYVTRKALGGVSHGVVVLRKSRALGESGRMGSDNLSQWEFDTYEMLCTIVILYLKILCNALPQKREHIAQKAVGLDRRSWNEQ